MIDAAPPKKFQFVAGDLCLDFCNTVGGKRGVIAREKLHSYADWLSWCEQAGLVTAARAEALKGKAARRPAEAASVLTRAVGLREAIYNISAALHERRPVAAADLDVLNSELARSLGRLRIGPEGKSFAWRWTEDQAALDEPLGPIARSAAELLTRIDALSHIHRCEGDTCGWLFLDGSRNHSRRWCDMRDCGNRAKVRRHRLKQHQSS